MGQKEAWEGGREGGRRDLPKKKVSLFAIRASAEVKSDFAYFLFVQQAKNASKYSL